MATTKRAAMKLGYVIFYVADASKTAEFWRDAFGCKIKFEHESGQYVELDTGNTTLGFATDALMDMQGVKYRRNNIEQEPSGAAVSLVTPSVKDAFAQAVEHGARTVKAVETKPWGQQSGLIRDINGILIEVCSPIEHRD